MIGSDKALLGALSLLILGILLAAAVS